MIKIQCTENGYCHPGYTVESQFVEPPRETRLGRKIGFGWNILTEIRRSIFDKPVVFPY